MYAHVCVCVSYVSVGDWTLQTYTTASLYSEINSTKRLAAQKQVGLVAKVAEFIPLMSIVQDSPFYIQIYYFTFEQPQQNINSKNT